jgi:meso-butanediol dehydrogenase/(S,S)-butanediol dehydrogenase/diacetyl reductase
VAGEIEGSGQRALALAVDVTSAAQIGAMVEGTVAAFGKVDILVNAAGVVHSSPVASISEAEWDRVLDINLKGTFLCCQAVLPAMRAQGGGRIINLASIAGKEGYPTLAHYCASKFGVVGFTSAVAREVAREGITVNAICPGIVQTAMWDYLAEARRRPGETADDSWERSISGIPQGRPQTPEDIGAAAVFLAAMDNVTGQAINVDGGMVSH